MPTALTKNGFRFFFYSNENDEPMHVHVTKGDAVGKIWLEPATAVDYVVGFTPAEQKRIIDIVRADIQTLKKSWNEHFSQ